MNHTHQDETPAQSEPTPPAEARYTTQLEVASESTPAKKKYGPNLAFTSDVKAFEKVRRDLAKEMDDRWLGAMPVDAFLDTFLRPAEHALPGLAKNPFQSIPNKGAESTRYDPFIAAIEGWVPHLQAVNTSTKGDTVNGVKLKTDISFYNRVEDVVPSNKTDFSRMELWMEFKTDSSGVAFRDPDDTEESRRLAIEQGSFTPATVEGNMARGQLAHYAGAQHSMQFRHFSFSVIIEGDQARFFRWEPGATVVTAAFNYRTHPGLMAEFLWRFDHLSAKERGHDESVQLANLAPDVATRVREKLKMKDNNVPLYQYEVPGLIGKGHAYGPRPPTENRSLASRCTRSLSVVWIPTKDVDTGSHAVQDKEKTGPWSKERIIYMKDTWRFLSNSPDIPVMAEHEIYEVLHSHGTSNIPEHVAGGDVDGGKTKTQEFVCASWLCVRPRISPFQHYRLVHGVVGRALVKFECTKQLVTAVFDALQAHAHAFEVAKILHRDISVGNIILTDEGKGLLIDWELAKKVDEGGSRQPDRTGTWQFMSANLLRHPGKLHTLTDDLESFLHVLGWVTLRYVPAIESYEAGDRGNDMAVFDEHLVRQGGFDCGGHRKAMVLRGGAYPSDTFRTRKHTPLFKLLRDLSKPFRSLYGEPPTDEDRTKIKDPPNLSDRLQLELYVTVTTYDEDIKCLQSSGWFIDGMKKALDEREWPGDDKADGSLPIAFFSGETREQVRIKTSQLQRTREIWENSKGLSGSSKRAASPTPEPSAKRRRCTPAASGSQT